VPGTTCANANGDHGKMPRTEGMCMAAAEELQKHMMNNTGALLNGAPVPMCNFDAEANVVQWNPLGPDGSSTSSGTDGSGGDYSTIAKLNAVCVDEDPQSRYSTALIGTPLEIVSVADSSTGVMIEIKVMSTRTVAPKLASTLLQGLFGAWDSHYSMSHNSVLFSYHLASVACRDYTNQAVPSGPLVSGSVSGSVCARAASQMSPIILGVTTHPERATCCLGYRGSEPFPLYAPPEEDQGDEEDQDYGGDYR